MNNKTSKSSTPSSSSAKNSMTAGMAGQNSSAKKKASKDQYGTLTAKQDANNDYSE